MIVHITQEPILLEKFFSSMPERSCGALVSFAGIVRDHDHGRPVRKLYYDCYVSMADLVIEKLTQEAQARWSIDDIRILHRVGELEIGEVAVAIAVSSVHRDEAFLACRFAIEEIKKNVPIWKKEVFMDGAHEWVGCSHAKMEAVS